MGKQFTNIMANFLNTYKQNFDFWEYVIDSITVKTFPTDAEN